MRNLNSIEQQEYDLIIIGGGINGAGVARDAALRGLKTILLEKADFASGSSSWSSRLIHGGLRYLEYFEFPLVRESLKEREILFNSAAHLVHPLLLTIPVYRDRSRPYWKIWAGMILYDFFSFDKTVPILTAEYGILRSLISAPECSQATQTSDRNSSVTTSDSSVSSSSFPSP